MQEGEKQANNANTEGKTSQEKGKRSFLFGQKHEKEAESAQNQAPLEDLTKATTSAKKPEQVKQQEEKKQPTSEEKIKELTESIQRLQAEFENYQKRSTKQNEEFKIFANAKVIEEILPVLDSLEQGMLHNKEFVHIYEQLFSILKKKGLQKIHAEKGMKFNHDTMECMLSEKNPALKEDAVVNVLITGYLLNGKVLRAVKVSVNTLAKENEENKISEKEDEKNGGDNTEKRIKSDVHE